MFIERAARTDAPVLLLGETGTGKSRLARLIHEGGPRAGGPFRTVNCAGLPDSLIERELFGHVAGAYTDARTSEQGLFQSADGGTLFLDEVAELSPAAQAKLLVALESGVIRRLGSTTDIHVNVRVIAATNADLGGRVRQGLFRADLYYRLAVLRLTLPPLRNRKDAIEEILRFALQRDSASGGLQPITRDAMDAIFRYPWPGNIRELLDAIQAARTLSQEVVDVQHLPMEVAAHREASSSGGRTRFIDLSPEEQREALMEALRQTGGNRTHAARQLGIARSTLWVKMQLYVAPNRTQQGRVAPVPALVETDARLGERSDRIRVVAERPFGGQRPLVIGVGAGLDTARRAAAMIRHSYFQAWRALRARPSAALAMTAVLALGVALLTALFALAEPYVLKPVPYHEPENLVVVTLTGSGAMSLNRPRGMPAVSDWEARTDLFESLAGYRLGDLVRFRVRDRAVAVRTAYATDAFFNVLRVPMAGWMSGAARPGAETLGLVLLGQTTAVQPSPLPVDGTFPRGGGGAVRVLGTLPPGFVFPSPSVALPVSALTPISATTLRVDSATALVGRLRAGVPLAAVASALEKTLPVGVASRVQIKSMDDHLKGSVRPLAIGAIGAGLLILLVCIGNVANLFLVRSVYRAREFGMRQALGATPSHLLALIGAELSLVSLAAVAVGVWLANLAIQLSRRYVPSEYVVLGEPSLTSAAVAVACLAGVCMILGGVLAAAAVWRAAPAPNVGEVVARDTPRIRRVRFAAIAAQSTFATVLILGAALLVRSYVGLVSQPTGFTGDVIVLTTSYPSGGPVLQRSIQATIDRINSLPGVEGAAAAVGSMLDQLAFYDGFRVNGEYLSALTKRVTAGYFEAVGSSLSSGRFLTEADRLTNGVVVSESFANHAWPGLSAIGRRIGSRQESEVVGVIRDERHSTLAAPARPTVFSLLERVWEDCSGSACGQVSYVVRVRPGAGDIAALVEQRVIDSDPDAVVVGRGSIDARLASTIRDRTFAAAVLLCFAVAAAGVCASGLLGTVGFIVSRRSREIAIRMAIGATARNILRVVLGESLAAVGVGLVMGVVAGRLAARTLEHMLFGVRPGDWGTALIAGAILLAAAIIGTAFPARRALSLSPTHALRVE